MKCLNPTSGTPNFYILHLRYKPPKHVALKTNRTCIHDTHKGTVTLEVVHVLRLTCPIFHCGIGWLTSAWTLCGKGLIAWLEAWPGGQASDLTHIWGPTGVLFLHLVPAGGCCLFFFPGRYYLCSLPYSSQLAPSSLSPSATLQSLSKGNFYICLVPWFYVWFYF